jgi:hypothetical protein
MVNQSGKARKPFQGAIQLIATTVVGGRPGTVTWPRDRRRSCAAQRPPGISADSPPRGRLDLPEDATIRSVQLRVLEGGAVRAQQIATP